MDKKIFEESLIRLFPGCSGETVQGWLSFAEECIEMGQFPDFLPVSDRDTAVGKWLDAIYKGLYRAEQEYGTKPAEQICGLSVKHCLYPWEMMEAARYLKNGGDIEDMILMSVEGLLDECDAKECPEEPEQKPGKEAYPPKKERGR